MLLISVVIYLKSDNYEVVSTKLNKSGYKYNRFNNYFTPLLRKRHDCVADVILRTFVYRRDVHDQVEQFLRFPVGCVQGSDGILGSKQIVAEVVQLDLDGRLIPRAGYLLDIILITVLLPVGGRSTDSMSDNISHGKPSAGLKPQKRLNHPTLPRYEHMLKKPNLV